MADVNIVLAVDVGNTRVKLGVVDVERHECIRSSAFATADAAHRFLPAVKELVASQSREVGKVVAVSSVVRGAGEMVVSLLAASGCTVRQLTGLNSLPLTIAYNAPQELGADRVANALYCVTYFSGTATIVISAGTAIVVDYVADNTLYGGAILPGINTQFRSLCQAADRLPLVAAEDREVPAVLGTSTTACIRAGVFHGAAAAVSGIVEKYRGMQGGKDVLVVATGGDWPRLAPLVTFKSIVIPDLTLIGTACLLAVPERTDDLQ